MHRGDLWVVCMKEALLLPCLTGYPTYLVTKVLGFAALLGAQALLAPVPVQYRWRGGTQVAHLGCGQLTQPKDNSWGSLLPILLYRSCCRKALSGFTCNS